MALIAFFALAALWSVGENFGLWGVAGVLAALAVIEMLIRRAITSQRQFRFLDPLEQALSVAA